MSNTSEPPIKSPLIEELTEFLGRFEDPVAHVAIHCCIAIVRQHLAGQQKVMKIWLGAIAEFPITDPKNMDAMNMREIAKAAIAAMGDASKAESGLPLPPSLANTSGYPAKMPNRIVFPDKETAESYQEAEQQREMQVDEPELRSQIRAIVHSCDGSQNDESSEYGDNEIMELIRPYHRPPEPVASSERQSLAEKALFYLRYSHGCWCETKPKADEFHSLGCDCARAVYGK